MRTESTPFWQELEDALVAAGVTAGPLGPPRGLGGGCLHDAAVVDTPERRLFVKRNHPDCVPMFAAEAHGLRALAAPGVVTVPEPLHQGMAGGHAFLVTQFVEMGRSGDARGFGERLARLHASRATAFGLDRDNWIGTTPQPNGWHRAWVSFWRERRLGHQLALAEAHGRTRLAERGRRLAERLEALFAGHSPQPSLLHGDLWAGNYGYDRDGIPCLFDPAAYYGDREADLAMTELFGGFDDAFYAGYKAVWPLDAGYRTRRELYNLYHVLNHAHLFGGPYAGQAERMIERLLAETGA